MAAEKVLMKFGIILGLPCGGVREDKMAALNDGMPPEDVKC